MEDDKDAGQVTVGIRRLTQFILALGSLAAAIVAFNTDWGALKSALFGQAAHGAPVTPGPMEVPGAVGPSCVPDEKAAWNDANDCYVAYRAGQIAQAESTCNRGLVEARCANRKDIEGMIYFSLGLCAESRSDWKSAQNLYESSLRERPGNGKVQARLDVVSVRLAATAGTER